MRVNIRVNIFEEIDENMIKMSGGKKNCTFLLLNPVWSLLGGQGSKRHYIFLGFTGKRFPTESSTYYYFRKAPTNRSCRMEYANFLSQS